MVNNIKNLTGNLDFVSNAVNSIFKIIKRQPIATDSKVLFNGVTAGIGAKKDKYFINNLERKK